MMPFQPFQGPSELPVRPGTRIELHAAPAATETPIVEPTHHVLVTQQPTGFRWQRWGPWILIGILAIISLPVALIGALVWSIYIGALMQLPLRKPRPWNPGDPYFGRD